MKVKMAYKVLLSLSLILYCGSLYNAYGQAEPQEIFRAGKASFTTYCSPCHSVHQEKMGPMLASITRKRSEEWLLAFIRNSQQVILSGDEYANFLFQQYNQAVMPSFKKLPEKEIQRILFYIGAESENPKEEIVNYSTQKLNYSEDNIPKGRFLFINQCSSCHAIGKDGIGPSLGSVTNRRSLEWLMQFIQNSQTLIKAADPYAVHLFNSYDHQVMPPFKFLAEEEIISILDYIEYTSASPPYVAGVNGKKITMPPASLVYHESSTEINKETGIILKTAFIIISVLGAIVHVYLVVKLFRYLLK